MAKQEPQIKEPLKEVSNITQEDLGKLHPKEIQLLYFLRNRWRFGDIIIRMDNGVPKGVIRYVESNYFD